MDNNFTPEIGKDIIDSLTISMYENALLIYREYIQNSADQIDKAISLGIESKDNLHIDINISNDSIEIYDNATGISCVEAESILKNIAKSTKERDKDKGFRGIGRLAGLAYCEKLIFETSYEGEDKITKIIWDAKKLKDIINNRKEKETAISVIKEVTTTTFEKTSTDNRFFRVTLKGVTNSNLLDKAKVRSYLNFVAPIPYAREFLFGQEIKAYVEKNNLTLDEYNIYLGDYLIEKAYTTRMYEEVNSVKKNKNDDITSIKFFKDIDASSGELLYWGWYGISEFNGQLNICNPSRGIRLRKHNIQIGAEDRLNGYFKESRGNFYFIGEIHGVSKNLIPNSQRDHFSENNARNLFENRVKKFFHTELHELYHRASDIRSALKDISNLVDIKTSIEEKEKKSLYTNNEEREKDYNKLKAASEKAKKSELKINNLEKKYKDTGSPVNDILQRTKKDTHSIDISDLNTETPKSKIGYRTDRLTFLSKSDRKLMAKIYTTINDFLDKELADELISKIEESLKR